jgi:hypothetical protein
VSFATITLCVVSRRVFIVVVYFVIDSIRKLLDTPSYICPRTTERWLAELVFVIFKPLSLSLLGFTAQLRPWPPPQNPAEFLGDFSTIFFFTG